MSDYEKLQVGTLVVTSPREVTENYECAAWHKTLVVDPGSYPVFVYLTWMDRTECHLGHTLYASCKGVVKSASFTSRLGAHHGNDHGPQLVGEVHDTTIEMATFQLGEEKGLKLNPAIVSVKDGHHMLSHKNAGRTISADSSYGG